MLYFYPRDNTPGCSLEAESFRDKLEKFEALNAVVLGVSRDNVRSHLNFHLLSDPEAKVHKIFDVLKPKKRFGKEYIGTERSTFIINKDGILIKEYRKVKVKGHVEQVLQFIRENCV